MRKPWTIILLWLCLLWVNVCFAQDKKEEWVDKSYDFKQVKTVVVRYTVNEDIKLTETERRSFDEMFRKVFFKEDRKAKIKYLSLEQAEEVIEKTTGLNLQELRVSDNEQYEDVMQKHLPAAADAILEITVNSQGYSTRHVPSTIETYTDYEYRTVYEPYINSWGQHAGNTAKTVKVPVEKVRVVPEHDVRVAHAGAEFKLITTKEQQRVWMLLDVREADNKTPKNMAERILKRAKDKLRALTKAK